MEYEDVVNCVVKLLKEAHTKLPDDVVRALRNAAEMEDSEIARRNLENILKNVEIARKRGVPMCQDTGIPVFFVEVGRELDVNFDIKSAIYDGVRKATKEVPLRANAVHPVTRQNSGDNTGKHIPQINFDIVEGDEMRIAVLPKGAGSENVSRLKMLTPAEVDKIEKFIVETVLKASGKPCPPIVLGVGIGGTFDGVAKLAKKALLRDLTSMDDREKRILDTVNSLGIGPMGLGGKTTALAVLIEEGHCHTASLPVAVNVQCWANRRAVATLR